MVEEGVSRDARGKGIWEGSKELFVSCELKRNDESGKKVESVLDVLGKVREEQGRKGKNMLLEKGDHALLSSSCVRRKPGERHLLAL